MPLSPLTIPHTLVPGTVENVTDVKENFDACAEAINALVVEANDSSSAQLVTSLPAAPSEDTDIYYLAGSTNGIVWHLRYRTASASTYKWEYVGGSPLFSRVDTDGNRANTAYGALGSAGPSMTLPLAGDYMVSIGYQGFQSVGGGAMLMSYSVGATAASDNWGIETTDTGTVGEVETCAATQRHTSLAAATQLIGQYRNTANTANFRKRWMSAVPVRVG